MPALDEGGERAAAGDAAVLRMIAGELAAWFPQHAQSMDAALALHLRSVGHDPASGRVARPEALPPQEISGCGSAACSPAEAR